MKTEDFRTISELGNALWVDPNYSERVGVEKLAAVSLLGLNRERALERAARLLFLRALKDGVQANSKGASQPFYRLLVEERFILVALHSGRWSYARIARVLELDEDEIPRLAWQARLRLAMTPGKTARPPHPTGSKGLHCPEYRVEAPWTQKFLDEELQGRELIFIQNHLMACSRCRETLMRCRSLYFAAESLIPRLDSDGERIEIFDQVFYQNVRDRKPTFLASLAVFQRRWDVRVVLVLMFLLGVMKIFVR